VEACERSRCGRRRVFLALSLLWPAGSVSAGGQDPEYSTKLLAERKARDEEFRRRELSPLAGILIAALDKESTVIGSSSEADLRLAGEGVADRHAEIVTEPGVRGAPAYRIRPLGGAILTDTEPPKPVADMVLPMRTRVRIGRFVVSWNNLGTFGPVVRIQDFSSPAFTRFDGLRYFDPDPSYRVEAIVRPFPRPERSTVLDTHGWQRPAWKYGEASFALGGRRLKLVLLVFTPEPKEGDTFFIPFSDETRGRETYPAARYLEAGFVRAGVIELDFNRATNPLCAYNTGFACPLPPRENRLPVEIRAGEKLYPHAVGH